MLVNLRIIISVSLLVPVCWGPLCYGEESGREKLFRREVEPILVGRCLECHGADRKGELDLRSLEGALAGGETGPVIEPGNPNKSLLFQHVYNEEMPPKKPLSDEDVDVLERWIEDGAFYPDSPLDLFSVTTTNRGGYDWWSLRPVRTIDLPETVSQPVGWNSHPIDRFVSERLQSSSLSVSGAATPRAIIRRATYDLAGLPPTPKEVNAFVEQCRNESGSPQLVGDKAYEELIERLLASPRYGEHWGRHWLDVVRFGESTGFEVNHLIDNMWPYRDYIIKSFNEDKPFDRLAREQIAGDSIDGGNPEVEVGMTFLIAGPYDIVGNQDPKQAAQIRANTIDDIIRATGESFLGLTVGCARCHDHKFDPISQKDYYRMYATFAGVHHDNRVVATESAKQERGSKVAPLRKQKDGLNAEKRELEKAILERAKARAEDFETLWVRPTVDRMGTEETFEPVQARHIRLISEGNDTNPRATTGHKFDEFEVWSADSTPRNVAAAANGGTAAGESRVAQDFDGAYKPGITIDGAFGERWLAIGPKLTITFAQPEMIRRVLFSSDRPNELGTNNLAAFVCEYRLEVSLDGETWTEVANSHDRVPANDRHRDKRYMDAETTDEDRAAIEDLNRQIRKIDGEMAKVPQLPVMRVGRLTELKEPFHVFGGGDPQRKGEPVQAASLDALKGAMTGYALANDAPERERRRELADWIASPENPLTARVLVNRLWHYHFGTGIVPTPSDFGYMGSPPTHPELLDWLARELTHPTQYLEAGEDADNQAWRLKRMHKLIMMSQTYRQSSAYQPDAARIDADSRLLWRFPPRRLSGEEIRDTVLAISGNLNTEMGGPGFRMYHYLRDNVSTYVPMDAYGPETYRRSIYHQNARASRVDLMTEYDSPDCALAAPRRVTTTTPLQALTHMNHSFTLDMASALAERIEKEVVSNDRGEQVQRAFQLAYSRPADESEQAEAVRFIEEYGLPAYCRALLNTNELVYID